VKFESIDVITVLEYWLNKDKPFGIIIETNAPTCWGCGQTWNGAYDVVTGDHKKAWNKAPLQVCHVIPKSLGGSNDPSNLVLMCKECHDLAPNTVIPEIMFTWMSRQSHLKRYLAKIKIALKDFDISEAEFEQLTLLSKKSEFNNWASGKAGQHWPQSGFSGFGHKMTFSTYVGLLKWYSDNVANAL
jgi:5-methylcytosine-specific restriction endonuclease McrA